MLFSEVLLITLLLHSSIAQVDQVPITDIQLYSQVAEDIQLCVSSELSTYSTSFGCSASGLAKCICLDSSKSYKVASGIRTCGEEVAETTSDVTTGTLILASYCLTNAGVSARDQTLLEDFPIFNQATFGIRYCAPSITSVYSKSYGCDFVTPAGCLCSNSQSSSAIQDAMLSCASQENVSVTQRSTASILWSSYCNINLATSATRQINAVTTASGSSPTGLLSSAAPSATVSAPASKYFCSRNTDMHF